LIKASKQLEKDDEIRTKQAKRDHLLKGGKPEEIIKKDTNNNNFLNIKVDPNKKDITIDSNTSNFKIDSNSILKR
jgi:hypothetical protein